MSERLFGEPRTATYVHEVAVSAALYDTLLVDELTEQLAPRLGVSPFWSGHSIIGDDLVSHSLAAKMSRLVIVLHQRLWSHDPTTRADAEALQERLRTRAESVCVIALDATPLPEWLTPVATCSLADVGLDGAIACIVTAIDACGGRTRAAIPRPVAPVVDEQRFDRHAPFLEQHRAYSALRHELDALAAELKARCGDEEPGGRGPGLQSLPNRLVVRLGSIGLSFSWISGGLGTVADGRLLVIEWTGMQPRTRGATLLESAIPVHERVYRPEAAGPDAWRWRVDDRNGCAYSTANLASKWLAGASIAGSA